MHDHVARRAGTDSTTGMVKPHLEAFGNVQNAARQAVVAVGDLFRIDFDGLAAGKKRHLVFLRGRLVFDFFNVWICAAHLISFPIAAPFTTSVIPSCISSL